MSQRWWLIIVLLLSLGLNLGFLASRVVQQRTQDPSEGTVSDPVEDPTRRDRPVPRLIRRMADELGLEGERRAAFVEIQRTFFQQTLEARARMADLQEDVRGEVTSADPDRQQLDQLLSELSTAHRDLEGAFVTNLLDARELLDDDQERRYMRFLRRMRNVRADVEQRFRERWRRPGAEWPAQGGAFERRRPGRFGDRRPAARPSEPPPASEPADGDPAGR